MEHEDVYAPFGVVAISWLIGMGAAIIGVLLIYLAAREKRVRSRIAGIGQRG